MSDQYRYDCRLFTGYKPCPYDSECSDCTHYEPMGARILVVRVHQLGNVIKSTPILHALRRKYDPAWITWLTSPVAAPLLRRNPLLDEVIEYTWQKVPLLLARRFDLVISLEADPAEVALAQLVPADEHLGYGIDEGGKLCPANDASASYVRLSVSDSARFRQNDRTLPQLCFDLLEVPYEGEQYTLYLSEDERAYAVDLLASLGVDPEADRIIALATGGNTARFETKDWPPAHFATLARLLHDNLDARVLLVGGRAEAETNAALKRELGDLVIDSGCNHAIRQFCALLSLCDLVVSADAFPLHAAVAVGTKVVGIFGPTPPQEIAMFGQGRKVVTDMPCAPCYIRTRAECPYDGACMTGISPEVVMRAARDLLR